MLSKRLIYPTILLAGFSLAGFVTRSWMLSVAEETPGRFVPPDERARNQAIGSTNRAAAELRRALQQRDQFDPIPAPGPSDWLAQHAEPGQTFDQFVRGRPNRPTQKRNKIYLQPLGDFSDSTAPDLDQLRDFASHFFGLPVDVLESASDSDLPFKRRQRGTYEQWLSTDVLQWLKGRVSDDAFCLLAVTMTDLYPQESWNFVFGQASLRERVGVYSFARYHPRFYGKPTDENTTSIVLERSCKVLAHETGHMFGIQHCIYFHCLMNGSNHMDESDRQPLHLCPVCLRKLQWSVGFDVPERYHKLKTFADTNGLSQEADWLETRLDQLN